MTTRARVPAAVEAAVRPARAVGRTPSPTAAAAAAVNKRNTGASHIALTPALSPAGEREAEGQVRGDNL